MSRRSQLLSFTLIGTVACGDSTGGTATTATTQTGAATDVASTTDATQASATDPEPTSTTDATPTDPTTGLPGSTDTGFTPEECVGAVQRLVLVRPRAVLVLERATSMTVQKWDHDADPATPEVTLWSSLHAAVDGALADHEARAEIGAELYPAATATDDYDESACPVDPGVTVPMAPNNRAEILAAMPDPGVTDLDGGWPVTAALTDAYEHLRSFDPDDARIAVLVLHRVPSCSSGAATDEELFEVHDVDTPPLVESAFTDDGILTHVIALAAVDAVTGMTKDSEPDGINPVVELGQLATKGGTELVNAATEAEVGDAVRAALATLPTASCALPLKNPLQFADQAVVRISGMDLARVDDCAAGDGWTFVEAEPPYTAIELCGAACEQLFQIGEAEVEDCGDAPA